MFYETIQKFSLNNGYILALSTVEPRKNFRLLIDVCQVINMNLTYFMSIKKESDFLTFFNIFFQLQTS